MLLVLVVFSIICAYLLSALRSSFPSESPVDRTRARTTNLTSHNPVPCISPRCVRPRDWLHVPRQISGSGLQRLMQEVVEKLFLDVGLKKQKRTMYFVRTNVGWWRKKDNVLDNFLLSSFFFTDLLRSDVPPRAANWNLDLKNKWCVSIYNHKNKAKMLLLAVPFLWCLCGMDSIGLSQLGIHNALTQTLYVVSHSLFHSSSTIH